MRLSDIHKRVFSSKEKLLLDLFPNAAAAYSLRKIRTAYTGNCIEVRRSSDNALQNIGFLGNELDTVSLLNFVGSGDGFVKTWYDQSLQGRNVSQSSNSSQPILVSNGLIISNNMKPTLHFDGNNRFLFNLYGILDKAENVFVCSVFSTITIKLNQIVYSFPSGIINFRGWDVRLPNATQLQLAINAYPETTTSNALGDFNYSTGNYNLITGTFNAPLVGNEHKVYANGNLLSQVSNIGTGIINNGSNGGLLIGKFGTTNMFGETLQGNFAELIVYKLDQSLNRTSIENNINSHYNIF
jgi:hypothetical protein